MNKTEGARERRSKVEAMVWYLLDVASYVPAIQGVEEVEGFGGRRHRLHLHLQWHVRFLDHCLPFQHTDRQAFESVLRTPQNWHKLDLLSQN